MAEIKGITIEIDGDVTGLQKAINKVRTEAKSFDKELGYIDRALKFNPKNIDLMKQKMAVLSDATKAGEKNIEDMKKTLAEMRTKNIDETSADYRELEREIIKAESKQKEYNAQLRSLKAAASGLGQAAQKMKDFGSKATAAGEAMRGISTVAAGIDVALAGLAYRSGVAADDLNTLSKVTGISTQELQKYKAASDLVDVSVEAIAKSQQKLKNNMLGALDGTNEQAQYFEELGVSITNADGSLRDAGDVFDDTIAALGKMENETQRDAYAMALMGKSATELNPLIEDGGEAYQRLAEVFEKNELQFVDQETLDQANRFNDELDTIKATWGAAINTIGMQLAGYLAPALSKISEFLQKVASWLSKLSPETLTIIGIIAGVVAGIAPLLLIVGKLAMAIGSIMSLMSTLGVTFGAIAGPVGIAIGVIAALIAIGVLLYKNWDKIKAKAKEIKDFVVKKWNELKTSVVNAVNNLKNSVTNAWNAIKNGIKNIVISIAVWAIQKFLNIRNSIVNAITSLKNGIVNIWNAIKDGIKNIAIAIAVWTIEKFWNIKTRIINAVTSLKNGVINIWDSIKTKIKDIVTSIGTWVSDKFSAIRDRVLSVIDAIKNGAAIKFEALKNAITHPIERAKQIISDIISKIKNIVGNLKLSLPKFKLPHFKISGGKAPWGLGGMGTAPSINVDWYKKGGIFTSPQIIGVGDSRSPEAVIPIDKLKAMLGGTGDNIVINVYGSNNMDVNELALEVQRKLINLEKRRRNAWA